ncbi:unnamed protein product, partial [Rotaria sordida]
MNNTGTNKTMASILKNPSQDAQGHWYELLSPTQVLTGQQQQPQEYGEEKKKKKCRGNRRAQRLRRRLRQQGIDPDTITQLVNQRINSQQQEQHDEAIQNDQILPSTQHKDKYDNSTVKKSIKRKRNETSANIIDKSLSQLSISQST